MYFDKPHKDNLTPRDVSALKSYWGKARKDGAFGDIGSLSREAQTVHQELMAEADRRDRNHWHDHKEHRLVRFRELAFEDPVFTEWKILFDGKDKYKEENELLQTRSRMDQESLKQLKQKLANLKHSNEMLLKDYHHGKTQYVNKCEKVQALERQLAAAHGRAEALSLKCNRLERTLDQVPGSVATSAYTRAESKGREGNQGGKTT